MWLVNSRVVFDVPTQELTSEQRAAEVLIIESAPRGTDGLVPQKDSITIEPPEQGMYNFPRSGE
jgi:hypothetical protein